jgi:hypothetical protein
MIDNYGPEKVERIRPIETIDTDLPKLLNALASILWPDEVDRKTKKVGRELTQERGFYLEHWVKPMRAFWTGLLDLRRWAGRSVAGRGDLSPQAWLAWDAAAKVVAMAPPMRESRRAELARRVLTSDNLMPVLIELNVAAHYWQIGYDLDWPETAVPNARPSPDFIAEAGKATVEVECKGKELDAGRLVTRKAFYRLADAVVGTLDGHDLTGEVLITIPARIPSDESWREQVSEAVLGAPGGKRTADLPDRTRVEVELRPRGPILTPAESWENRLSELRTPFAHVAYRADAVGRAVSNVRVVRVVSERPDRVLDDVLESLRGAVDQFSRRHQAVIVCYLPEIENLESLAGDSGLNRQTQFFFERHAGPFVKRVEYYSDVEWARTSFGIGSRSPVLQFENPRYDRSFG